MLFKNQFSPCSVIHDPASERLHDMATHSSVRFGRGRGQRRGESRRPGQWKLAYADFLTALMAFFLLMWLSTDSSHAERSAIASYFTGAEVSEDAFQHDLQLAELTARLSSEIQIDPAFSGLNEHIRLTPRPNGIRIDLTDAETGSLFANASSVFSEPGTRLAANIGRIIAPMPLFVTIEGHTDAFKTAPDAPSNWDISAARANAALRLIEQSGVASDRFKAVSGLAATQPLLPNQPHAPANRRISILLELTR